MEHDKSPNSSPRDSARFEEDEINLLDLILVLVRHKKMIFLSCLSVFILTSGITLLLPDIYSATARVLPLEEKDGGAYLAMLKGQKVADAIIDKFDLQNAYEVKSRNLVYPALDSHVSISEGGNDHVISITVEDKDPNRAAGIANALVEELKKLSEKYRLTSVANLRKHLEGRLEIAKEDLARAEQNLKAFQDKNKAIRIDVQTLATIEAFARLKGEMASKEIELGMALPAKKQQIPQDAALREGFEELKYKVSALELSPVGEKVPGDVALVTASGPVLGVQYAGLLRDFRMQVALFELLTWQYEVARIKEVRAPVGIQVLEPAFPPAKKSKPKRGLMVMLFTLAAGIFAVLAAFFHEYGNRMCDRDRQRWDAIKDSLRLR